MSGDNKLGAGVPGFRPDVPGSSIILKSKEEAARLALRLAGEEVPDECRFSCIQCGWNKTLQFDKDEIEALGGDIRSYAGPCGSCGLEMLRPYDSLGGSEFKPISQRAKDNRKAEYGEASEVFLDKMTDRIGNIMGGMMPNSTLDPSQDHKHTVPGQRGDLPKSEDIDLSDLKPRRG